MVSICRQALRGQQSTRADPPLQDQRQIQPRPRLGIVKGSTQAWENCYVHPGGVLSY